MGFNDNLMKKDDIQISEVGNKNKNLHLLMRTAAQKLGQACDITCSNACLSRLLTPSLLRKANPGAHEDLCLYLRTICIHVSWTVLAFGS